MFKLKSFVSLSVLSFALSSNVLFAGKLEPVFQEEMDVVRKNAQLAKSVGVQQETFTYKNQTFIKGEVPGDGNCILRTLDVLFPEKGISREVFIQKSRQAIDIGGQEADEVKTTLAVELYDSLRLHAFLNSHCDFDGPSIRALVPQLNFMGRNGETTAEGEQRTEADIQKIKNNAGAIEDILQTLARDGIMLSLPDTYRPNEIGSFGLACKLFNLNLCIFAPNGQPDHLNIRKEFKFGGVDPKGYTFFPMDAAHVSPMAASDDENTRKRLANRILQMIDNMEGIYQTLRPSDPVRDLTDLVNSLPEQERKAFIKEREDTAVSTFPDPEERKNFLANLETVKRHFGFSQPAQTVISSPTSAPVANSLPLSVPVVPNASVNLEESNRVQDLTAMLSPMEEQERKDVIKEMEATAVSAFQNHEERQKYLADLEVIKRHFAQPVQTVITSPKPVQNGLSTSGQKKNTSSQSAPVELVVPVKDTYTVQQRQLALLINLCPNTMDAEVIRTFVRTQEENTIKEFWNPERQAKLEALDTLKTMFGIADEPTQSVILATRPATPNQIKFDLKPTTNVQRMTNVGQGTKVITDNNADANYQLESNRFDVAIGQEVHVSYNITVEKGGVMSLGFLNTARNGWYGNELILREGSHQGTYIQAVPSGEQQAALVFRNYHGVAGQPDAGIPGQTTFTIHEMDIERKAIGKGKLRLQKTNAPQSVTEIGQEIKVITDNNAAASYQLESNRFNVFAGQMISVPYDITVDDGGIMSLGLLNTARGGWYGNELILRAGTHNDIYVREVPADETQTSLVFRNYHGVAGQPDAGIPGQTTFTIHEVDFKID